MQRTFCIMGQRIVLTSKLNLLLGEGAMKVIWILVKLVITDSKLGELITVKLKVT